jgi:HEAT repeats/NACHT domain
MFPGFRVEFDLLSLLLGAILASIFWWLIQFTRPQLKQIRASFKKDKKKEKSKSSTGLEERYRKLVLRQVQGMHLAATLFSLDEIVIPPRLLAPPARVEPGMTHAEEDVVSQTLPYMPAFPELAATFRASSFSLAQALTGNINLVLIGHPGVGKSITLAHFASLLINHSRETNHLKGYIPFIVHASDLDVPPKSNDLINSLIDVLSEQASVFDAGRMPKFIKQSFEDGRAILLLDGLDELAPDSLRLYADHVKQLLKNYPKTRVVTTGSPEYVDGFCSMGFSPLVVLPWGADQQKDFLDKWADLWSRFVSNEAWAQSALVNIDSVLLNQWLKTEVMNLTPLEFTLKTWGAYAGDIRGSRPMDFVETHIRRMMPSGIPLEALGVLGFQVIANSSTIFDSRKGKGWIRSFEPADDETVPDSPEAVPTENNSNLPEGILEESPDNSQAKKAKRRSGAKTPAPKASLLSKLADSGLIENRRNGRMRFAHLAFGGILAGEVMNTASAGIILNQDPWSGRTLAMNSFAAKGNATEMVVNLLEQKDEMLGRNTLLAGRFLRDATSQAPWRMKVMTALVELIKSDKPIALRMQAVASITLSEDPAGALLFRQLMQLSDKDLRRMAILASGAIRDVKAADQIISLIGDYNPQVRHSACLALVAIGTPQTLEAVARALMRGDEDLRRAAAEALANNRVEGHSALQEGSSSKDILLRRAVVYGLARLDEKWVTDILEKIQVEDEQWVVRNAAVEVLESRSKPSHRIPRKMSPPHEAPWLIEFAGRYGVGIAPGAPTTDLLLRALKSDKEEEHLAALGYLKYMPSENILSGMYQVFFSTEDAILKEYIYLVLWEFALGGVKIPSPMQYGLG